MNAEQAAVIRDYFANLLEQESRTTARVLAAVPDSGRDYRPDEKSRTAWELATHVATADVWFVAGIVAGSFAMDPELEKRELAKFTKIADVVEYYNREFPAQVKALRAVSGEHLAQTVDFFGMQMPNVNLLGIANNHGVHHRGQLASYLRAMGSKVPSIYGGSADEPFAAA